MVIGVDIRVLAKGTSSGVEEYTIQLLKRLVTLDPRVRFRLFYSGARKIKLDLKLPYQENTELREYLIPSRVLDISSKLFNTPKIDRLMKGCDVFFSPHFLLGNVSRGVKRVVTFHDLSFVHFPEFFSRDRMIWHVTMNPKKQAQDADAIIAVSASTKTDLEELYGIRPEKITVIHSGVSSIFRPIARTDTRLEEIRSRYHLPEIFVLYFGTVEPRKNIIGLITAFEILKSRNHESLKNLKLVIAGERGWLAVPIYERAKNSPYRTDIHFGGFVDEKDKPYVYNLATLFIYPSFFEGFGFPPLEAMACGVPVITSNTSSFPEVVGGAACMIDPSRPEELAGAMGELMKNEALRTSFVEKGIKRVQIFSWDTCARETFRVLQSV